MKKNASGTSAPSPLYARVARALAANREAKLNFPGLFMGFAGSRPDAETLVLNAREDPLFLDARGLLNWIALAVMVDVSLGAVTRAKAGPRMRPATVYLSMQMTGAPVRGAVTTRARFGTFTRGTSVKQCITSAEIEAGGVPVARASGTFVMLELARGTTQKTDPWADAALLESEIADLTPDAHERDALELCRRAEAAATPAHPFIEHFWCGIPEKDEGTARLDVTVTPHLGNRVGHVHGGALVGAAARVASAAVPAGMRLSNIAAWFVSPGLPPRLKVRAETIQRGRNFALVRTRVSDDAGKLVLEVTSQHTSFAE